MQPELLSLTEPVSKHNPFRSSRQGGPLSEPFLPGQNPGIIQEAFWFRLIEKIAGRKRPRAVAGTQGHKGKQLPYQRKVEMGDRLQLQQVKQRPRLLDVFQQRTDLQLI